MRVYLSLARLYIGSFYNFSGVKPRGTKPGSSRCSRRRGTSP
jgi:hypothetical protein